MAVDLYGCTAYNESLFSEQQCFGPMFISCSLRVQVYRKKSISVGDEFLVVFESSIQLPVLVPVHAFGGAFHGSGARFGRGSFVDHCAVSEV